MTQYAPRYRAARAYADLSQAELAEKLGVEVQTIKRRESGQQAPKKAELIALAAVCGVPLGFLEDGWGNLTADEVTQLLREQSQILADIRAATTAQRAAAENAEAATRLMEEAGAMMREEALRPAPETDQSGTSPRKE